MANMASMEVKFHHIPEENVLIEEITGEVTLEGIIEMKKESQRRDYLNSTLRTLSVFLDATLYLSVEDVKALTRWQAEHNRRQIGAKTAILATEPVAVALNLFYSMEAKGLRRIEVFSTYSAALKWLGLDQAVVSEVYKGRPL